MEQQSQGQRKTAQTQQRTRLPPEQTWTPEQARLSDAGLTARLALDGVSLPDLPPRRLEELAGLVGNSAMQALLDARTPQLEEAGFRMPAGEPGTVPFQVPETQPPVLARPVGLAGAAGAGAAADPAALAV